MTQNLKPLLVPLIASSLLISCQTVVESGSEEGPPPTAESVELAKPDPSARDPAEPGNFLTRLWESGFAAKEDAPPAATSPNWVGNVKAVSERHDYVLVDSQTYQSPAPGTILTSVGSVSESGSVRVSEDRDPPFFIADILSGRPEPGDRLYSPAP